MTSPSSTDTQIAALPRGDENHRIARSDLEGGVGWMALGGAILIASLRMDRLEEQNINPYTIPGLLPGLLGIVMLMLGFLLFVRSWRRGGLHPGAGETLQERWAATKRIVMVLALCATFAVILVGHGLPFWTAGALFVTVAILTLQHAQRVAEGQKLTLRKIVTTALIGLGAGLIITLVFQEIFLVRLP
jgi:hypothetical protein